MISKRYRLSQPRAQFGAATLVVALILLIAVTVTMLYTANTSVLEQRISANEVRAKAAAAAAQAGLDRALDVSSKEPDLVIVPDASWNGDIAFRAVYWDVDAPLPTECPLTPDGTFENEAANRPDSLNSGFMIISCGWSDDRAARSVVLAKAVESPAMGPLAETAPLVSRGAVDTGGNANIYNYFSNLTIWTGAGLDVTGKAGTTFIRNPIRTDFVPPSPLSGETPQCLQNKETQADDYYLCTTRGNTVGPDVVLGDRSLAELSEVGFFELATGIEATDDAAAKRMFLEQFAIAPTTNSGDLATTDAQVIWFEGNLDLNGGTVGSEDKPVVLIVEGNATIRGNTVINGITLILEDLVTSGNPKFVGSTLVRGDVSPATGPGAGGNPSFIYSPSAISGAMEATSRGIIAGTWRDWF